MSAFKRFFNKTTCKFVLLQSPHLGPFHIFRYPRGATSTFKSSAPSCLFSSLILSPQLSSPSASAQSISSYVQTITYSWTGAESPLCSSTSTHVAVCSPGPTASAPPQCWTQISRWRISPIEQWWLQSTKRDRRSICNSGLTADSSEASGVCTNVYRTQDPEIGAYTRWSVNQTC